MNHQHVGVEILGEIIGARPDAPREDLAHYRQSWPSLDPDVIVTFSARSTIDASKAGEVLRRRRPDCCQLQRPPDQVLQHYRLFDGAEEADCGSSDRPAQSCLRV